MRKPLILLLGALLAVAHCSQKTNVDNDIIFDESPGKESSSWYGKVLSRVKRQWSLFPWGSDDGTSTTTEGASSTTTTTTTEPTTSARETRSPDDEDFNIPSHGFTPDDEDGTGEDNSGSGEVGPVSTLDNHDWQHKRTLYRMTLLVEEAWDPEYESKAGEKFRTFAFDFSKAIDQLFDDVPGEQTSAVIKMEKSDATFILVTVDLGSIGNSNTKELGEKVENQINEFHRIGDYTVRSEHFTFFRFKECIEGEEMLCQKSDVCVPLANRCDGTPDCPHFEDEAGCSGDKFPMITIPPSNTTTRTFTECRGDDVPTVPCISNKSKLLCSSQFCDDLRDCPDGEDEAYCRIGTDCLVEEFSCDYRRCIPKKKMCDGTQDCSDGTDELNCKVCSPEDVRCNDGTCLSYMKRCDLIKDCPGGEDEENCQCDNSRPFRCDGDKCLPLADKCNGKPDCQDGSDEANCPEECLQHQWRCNDGDCILNDLRCDMHKDCLDGSDEVDCTACPSNSFVCENKHCIPLRNRCDGIYHCNDMSDERGCPPAGCPDGQFSCGDYTCIEKSKVCNNQSDCPDGRDERDCPRPCHSSEFRCGDGSCIPNQNTCDGTFDCTDNSDEDFCSFGECLPNEFRCRNGLCISGEYVCDGLNDCTDKSDELNCSSRPCHPNDFRCGDNKCISSDLKCDGNVDCYDASDEDPNICRQTCKPEEWQCNNGDCIPLNRRCDGHFDCQDSSDETNNDCPTTSTEPPFYDCRFDEFRCHTGICIPQYQVCDGISHCHDGSDEANCATPTEPPFSSCRSDEFRCDLGRHCLPRYQVCDGIKNCIDGSDEVRCAPRTTLPPPTLSPVHCSPWEFLCWGSRQCIPKDFHCDNKFDCPDGSDEENCAGIPLPNLKIYERGQIIKESREAVFRCRDEGPGRYKVKWTREGGQPLPPGSRSIEGRLEMPNVQKQHSGMYVCEAIGVPSSTHGARVSASLTVEQSRTKPVQIFSPTLPKYGVLTQIELDLYGTVIHPVPTFGAACEPHEATCYNRDCIPKNKVCDGHIDCGDGSDESRCHYAHPCQPNEFQCNNRKCVLKTWRCDGDNDCGDDSDELGCKVRVGGSQCYGAEFECKSKNQCIPRSLHCDGTIDCQDASDEEGCRPIVIITRPEASRTIPRGGTLVLTCTAEGVPTPDISWRKDWGHVPSKCTQSSSNGTGTLTCPNFQMEDCGAYTCEALNSVNFVINQRDTIACVPPAETSCPPGMFNEKANSTRDCIPCFCFGITPTCKSADVYVFQLPPPVDSSKLMDVYISPNSPRIDIRHNENLYHSIQKTHDGISVHSNLQSYDTYPYYALPERYHGKQLMSYGGYLSYTVQADTRSGQPTSIPDIIITGNNNTLIYRHPHRIEDNYPTKISAHIFENENWYKLTDEGERFARRSDIMMTLIHVDNILIRTQYSVGRNVLTTISDITMDSAQFVNTGLGKVAYVEQCSCPAGYKGLSCEMCDDGYARQRSPPSPSEYLGKCEPIPETCPRGYFGDPPRIPCEKCPCPLTSPPNQFTEDCILEGDNLPTCLRCPEGHAGRRCEFCQDGFVGNPMIPGGRCIPVTEGCNQNGSLTTSFPCRCKNNVVGRLCSECAPNSFHLSAQNQDGCINCFCMGVTRSCSSSRLYRNQIVAVFASNNQGFGLAPEYEIANTVQTTIHQGALTYENFQPKVYYWILPERFLDNKLTSYGGYLTYSLRYVPTPGGLSSRNNAADVKLFSRSRVNLYHYRNITVEPDRDQIISVPFLEQYWQREDGGFVDRENFLMALADLEGLYIKATYTTNTQSASLNHVYMDTATSENTGRSLALEVEQCDCPEGYEGLSCEKCKLGYKKANEGVYFGLCERCDCSGRSDYCNPETGDCYNCRDNWAGSRCEVCRSGFRESGGRCEPKDPCACDNRGSHYCDNGRCHCKLNVDGAFCDQCREGTFNLSAENEFGCLDCYCSDVSRTCQSSHLYYEPYPMNILDKTSNGFVLTDRRGNVVVKDGFILDESRNEIGYNFNQNQNDFFWALPSQFTGDKITSYGGNLMFTRRFIFSKYAYIDSDYDVILIGNGKSIYWQNLEYPQSNHTDLVETVEVPLVEGKWRRTDPRTGHSTATRRDILEILSQLTSILIRASAGPDTLTGYLSDVSLDVAISRKGTRPASGVEVCQCPNYYEGTSCERCANHYYRAYDNTCKKCDCNDREDSCYLGSDNEVHCSCQSGYYGKRCERAYKYAGNSTVMVHLTPGGNIYPAPGTLVSFTCEFMANEKVFASIEPVYDYLTSFKPRSRMPHFVEYSGTVRKNIRIAEELKMVVCTVYNYKGQMFGQSIAIISGNELPDEPIPVPPPNITILIDDSEPSIQIKEVGSSVRYRCSAIPRFEDGKTIQLRWSKLGGDLPYDRAYDDSQGNLQIVNLKVSDSGIYICTASDGISSLTQTVTLTVGEVHTPPVIRISPSGVDVYEGESIEIYCEGSGSPLPSLEWRRLENLPLDPNAVIRGGYLRIPSARKSDEGTYECIGRNSAGSMVKTITINVNTESRPPTPQVYIDPPSVSVVIGEPVTFECSGGYSSDYEVEWRREDGRPYSAQKEGRKLVFTRVRPEDSGVYQCTVRSVTTGRVIGSSYATITIGSSQPLYPSVKPQQQRVPQGLTAEFTCELPYDSYSTPNNIKWYKSGGVMPSTAEYLNYGRTLRIKHLTVEDRGVYVCYSVYKGRSYNISAMLEVDRREAPRIQFHPPDTNFILSVGNSLLIQCRVHGIPPPTVRWSKADGSPIPPHIATTVTNTIRFTNVQLSDAGQYICSAENEAGRDSLTATVEVRSPPKISIFPKDTVYLVAGQNLDLTCNAEGTPTPLVQWTRRDPNDPGLYPSENEITAQANYGTANMRVFQVSSEDSGYYWCIAQNDAQREVKVVQVYVEDYRTPEQPGEREKFWVPTGGGTEITCDIKSNRKLERLWVRADRNPLPTGVTQRDGTLYIRNASPRAQGEYICQVFDEQGRVQEKLGKFLHVIALPEITLHPAKQVVRPGEDAQIQCRATGEEPIEITWEATRPLPASVVVSGGVLMFRGITVSDAGRYICKAKNIAGLSEAAADVIVNEHLPRAPRVSVQGSKSRTTVQGSSVTLHCTSDYPAQMGWTKEQGPLPSSSVVDGDSLKIINIQPYHSGRYICSARTSTGGVGTDYIDLTVTQDWRCSGGFQCRSGECIHESEICDNFPQCADRSDELNCPRKRRGAVNIRLKIEPSIDIIRVGSTVDLRCITEGIPSSQIVWTKLGEESLGPNVQTISTSVLRIVDVTTSNAGPYRCSAQTESGTYTDDYTLNVQGNSLSNISRPIAAKTIVLKVGDTADISCTNDLEPPVSYKWVRQGGLPSSANMEEGKLTVNQVTAKDAGLYTCEATNGEVKMEIPTFIVVKGIIPKFESNSYVKLKTLFDAYMQFDIELLFKPEDPNGLILYNGRQPSATGGSDFVSFGLRNGYPEFRFDMGSGHANIVGRSPLPMGKWAKAKLNRNRKEGRLVINDEDPVIGTSNGRHQGLDLDLPLYLGSVPDFSDISKSAEFNTGFRGCISRLVIKNEEQNLTQAGSLDWVNIHDCDTCSENLCTNSGACQEAPNARGYVCLCPKGFSGEHCDRTGESCYSGLCGDGYCENTDRGYACKCPLGLIGSNCEHRIKIRTPSFENSYMAYSAPRDNGKIDITLKLNPADSRDALILYAAQNDFGTGNYISISVKDRKLEFRIDTGSGSPMVLRSNSEILPGTWMTINAGRDTREARLSIGHDTVRTTLTSGQRKEILLGTFLYLGGFDTSTGSVNPNVGVIDGFRGCISHIDISRMDLDILKSAKESANVGECPSGNPCRDSPCRNGATCHSEGSRYSCHCTRDYTGPNCERLKNDCEKYEPCGKKGECIPQHHGYKCHCSKGFSGQNCTIREFITTSFSMEGDGWVELPKEILSDVGEETEMELNIVTSAPDGILVWHGQGPTMSNGNTDFFSVAVVNGYVEVVFELGSGLGRVVSDSQVNDGQPHRIIVTRKGNYATLTVDERTTDGQSDGILSSLNANGNIYIGGVPDPRYMTNGRYLENFNGCIRNIRIQNSDVLDVSNSAISTVNLKRCPVSAK